jgi:DNA-binding YbaB/EbfC family protein
MKNLGQMLKQAQEMQSKLDAHEISGSSGGGMVHVTLNGKGEMRRIKMDPSLIDPKEAEMLEDLIVAAHKDAKTKLEAFLAEEMAKLTGGLKLPPGVKLPF